MPVTQPATQIVLEWFVAISVIAVGLSHMLHPKLWADLFLDLLQRPYGGLVIGTLTLPLGLAVALGHNVWVWHVPVIVTLLGWGWTIKGALYLLRPITPQQVAKEHLKHPARFAYAGMAAVVLGAVVIVDLVIGASRAA